MPYRAVAFESPRRSTWGRNALGLALAAYVALFAAGLIGLIGLVAPVGSVAVAAAATAGILLAGTLTCWVADRLTRPRRAHLGVAAPVVTITMRPSPRLVRQPHTG